MQRVLKTTEKGQILEETPYTDQRDEYSGLILERLTLPQIIK